MVSHPAPVRVCIGTAERYRAIEPHITHAIHRHASQSVEIRWMRAGENGLKETGCTGFSMYRYAVPELCGYAGSAIYLDVDMLVLSDIAELWDYGRQGEWVCLADGSTEVMVIDCSVRNSIPPIRELMRLHKSQVRPVLTNRIPLEWNCEDSAPEGAKLIHFTDLKRQPWFTPARSDSATELLWENERHYLSHA